MGAARDRPGRGPCVSGWTRAGAQLGAPAAGLSKLNHYERLEDFVTHIDDTDTHSQPSTGSSPASERGGARKCLVCGRRGVVERLDVGRHPVATFLLETPAAHERSVAMALGQCEE